MYLNKMGLKILIIKLLYYVRKSNLFLRFLFLRFVPNNIRVIDIQIDVL